MLGKKGNISDEGLLVGIKNDSEKAFKALFDRYYPMVLTFCRRVIGRGEEASDAALEVFVKIWTERQRLYCKEGSLKPVIYTVDAAAMHADGYTFYRSVNGVWLTKEVPAKYLSVNK